MSFAKSDTLRVPGASLYYETHCDDAHLLLKELSTEPAYVFGSSGGGRYWA
ncbi:MAG: hypothetical protein H0V70_04140 [Ktedonobacteraceae bacterium]|nr:hypothetical protein [Ktedonobacteraceae bacterium]